MHPTWPLLPLLWLPLLGSLLRVVASEVDGDVFREMIEELAENSLGVKEIQVITRIDTCQ